MTQPIQEIDLRNIADMSLRDLFRKLLGKPPKRKRSIKPKLKQMTLPGLDLSKTKLPTRRRPMHRKPYPMSQVFPYKDIDDFIRQNKVMFGSRSDINEISLSELKDVIKEIIDEETAGNKALNALQLALDVAGVAPAIGTPVNAVNTIISLLRAARDKETDERKKHIIDAGLNAVSMVPFASVVKLVKLRALRKPAVMAARAIKGGARTAPRSYEPSVAMEEGVGWGTTKDIKKDPKHITDPDSGKMERWRIKFQSEKDLKKHGTTEKSPVNEAVGDYAGRTPTDPMKIVELIMHGDNVVFFTNAGARGPVIGTTRRGGIFNKAQAEFAIIVNDNKKNRRVLTRESEIEALANTIIQQKMTRYYSSPAEPLQRTPGAMPINEALTPKTIAFIEKAVKEKGTRGAAVKLIDTILSNSLMGLTAADLPDTAIYANGLDGIETAIKEGDYKGAIRIAAETAREMVEEEGGEGILNENTITKSELREMVKELVNEMWIGWEQEEGAVDKRRVDPKDMERSLLFLRKVNPAAYAQLMTLPFGPVPSYAWEDPNHKWWGSEEAFAMRQSIKDAQREGPKPGGPTKVAKGAKYSWQTTADDIKE